jgi:hypothetical protein
MKHRPPKNSTLDFCLFLLGAVAIFVTLWVVTP